MTIEPTGSARETPQNPMQSAHKQDYAGALRSFREQLATTGRYDDPQYLTEVASTVQTLHESTASAQDEDTQTLHMILTQHVDVDGEKLSLHQASKDPSKLGSLLAQFDRYPMAKQRLIDELGYF